MELQYNIVNTNGWDVVAVCKELRKAVQNKTLCIDTTPHTSNDGRNVHLFEFIRKSGYDLNEFLYNYIRGIQPCMLVKAAKKWQFVIWYV